MESQESAGSLRNWLTAGGLVGALAAKMALVAAIILFVKSCVTES